MEHKIISVIIPTFNRKHLIGEAIDSILNQDITGYDIEILVIDDGSNDNTKESLKKYIDSNLIRYIYQENRGAGAARNYGISESRGEWITFLDSDDRWLPFHLSLQLSLIEKIPECKVVFSDFLIFTETGKWDGSGLDYWAQLWKQSINSSIKGNWKNIFSDKFNSGTFGLSHQGEIFDIYKGNIFGKILFHPCMPCWTTMISRQCLNDNIRFAENFPIWEDVWFSCLLAEKNEIYFMDVITAENRGHLGPRLTQADPAKRMRCHIDICSGIYFKSDSHYRPSDIELIGLYCDCHKNLLKEYAKNGMKIDAFEVRNMLDKMGLFPDDIIYLLYYLGSKLPGNPIYQLTKMKRYFDRHGSSK